MDRKEIIDALEYLMDDISAKMLEIEEKEGEEYDKFYGKLEEYYQALKEAIGQLGQLDLIHEISKCI